MSQHKIKFAIKPDGTVKYEVIGTKGTDCVGETAWIDDKLGGKGLTREFKPEYYEESPEVKIEN